MEQLDMIRAQQKSIDTLKQMLSQLLEGGRRPKPKTPSKKSKDKWKKGRARLLCIPRRRDSPTLSRPSLRLKREAIQRMRVLILKE